MTWANLLCNRSAFILRYTRDVNTQGRLPNAHTREGARVYTLLLYIGDEGLKVPSEAFVEF